MPDDGCRRSSRARVDDAVPRATRPFKVGAWPVDDSIGERRSKGGAVTADNEVISPELALVDPLLAASARARLQVPTLEPARPPAQLHEPRTVEANGAPSPAPEPTRPGAQTPEPPRIASRPSEAPTVAADRAPAATARRVDPPPRRSAAHSWRLLVAVAAVVAVGVTLLWLLDVRVEVGRTPAPAEEAGAGPPALTTSAAPTTSGSPTTTPPPASEEPAPPRKSAGSPRRFAWAPVASASGYHVEIFSGSSRVFAADVTRPELTVPARWKQKGKQRSLVSGEYRWYVWAVRGPKRATTAVVQAKLVVP